MGSSACETDTSPEHATPKAIEDSYSVSASARVRSELGVSTWATTVSDAKVATLGYSEAREVVVGWTVSSVPAEATEQNVAQIRFALQVGATEGAISISSEARPRMFENSFAERPEIVHVMELMRDDLRAASRGSAGTASMLTPLDTGSLVEESCSGLIHERCGEADRLTAEASQAIPLACGGKGVTAKKLWSSFLDELGIETECADAYQRYGDVSVQSRDCRNEIASLPACDCDRPTEDSPKCH